MEGKEVNSAKPNVQPPLYPKRESTLFFRLLNFELFMKPSWTIGILGTVAFIATGVYLYSTSVQFLEEEEKQKEVAREKLKVLKQKLIEKKRLEESNNLELELETINEEIFESQKEY